MNDIGKLLETDNPRDVLKVKDLALEKKIQNANDTATDQVDGSKRYDYFTYVNPETSKEFVKKFWDKSVPGAEQVWTEAHNGSPTERKGDELQMAVANDLGTGPLGVAAMERSFRAKDGKHDSPIDIVTKDNIVVECKNYNKISPSTLESFVEQAQTRLEPSANNGEIEYHDAVIVVPDGKLNEQDRLYAANMKEHPHIRICTQSELQQVLKQIRSQA